MSNPTTQLDAWAIAIQTASKKEKFDCILVPSEIAEMAAKKNVKAAKVGKAVSRDNVEKLTVKQLRKLAQANSISITRTKKDFIKLLKLLEPDVGLDSLNGVHLRSMIKKYMIGTKRSKEELIYILREKLSENG